MYFNDALRQAENSQDGVKKTVEHGTEIAERSLLQSELLKPSLLELLRHATLACFTTCICSPEIRKHLKAGADPQIRPPFCTRSATCKGHSIRRVRSIDCVKVSANPWIQIQDYQPQDSFPSSPPSRASVEGPRPAGLPTISAFQPCVKCSAVSVTLPSGGDSLASRPGKLLLASRSYPKIVFTIIFTTEHFHPVAA